MQDINGIELKAGQIVEIRGAFFKSTNGFFVIEHAPGDEYWLGNDYALCKSTKAGKLSTSKYSTAFWPLVACTNNYAKNSEAREHNAKNATIKVVGAIDNHEKMFELRSLEQDMKTPYYSDYVKEKVAAEIEKIKQSIGMK